MPAGVLAKIDGFFSSYPQRELKKGHILVFADENPKHITYIKSGQIRQYDITENGDEVVVNVFKPPAFFPMSWAIGQIPNRYFFAAHTKATVHQAPPEDALHFLKTNPDVMLDLLERLYSGVDGMQRRMAHLMGGNARSRLVFELINEARRFAKPDDKGVYVINMSEAEIGARAGLTRETVSREINELKKLGSISVTRKGIALENIDELEQILGPNL